MLAFVFRGPRGRGLALSLAIAYSVAAVAALVVLRSAIGGLGGLIVCATCRARVICSLFMAFVVALVLAGVGSGQGFGLLVRVVAPSSRVIGLRVGGRTRRERCRLANFETTAGARRGGCYGRDQIVTDSAADLPTSLLPRNTTFGSSRSMSVSGSGDPTRCGSSTRPSSGAGVP